MRAERDGDVTVLMVSEVFVVNVPRFRMSLRRHQSKPEITGHCLAFEYRSRDDFVAQNVFLWLYLSRNTPCSGYVDMDVIKNSSCLY